MNFLLQNAKHLLKTKLSHQKLKMQEAQMQQKQSEFQYVSAHSNKITIKSQKSASLSSSSGSNQIIISSQTSLQQITSNLQQSKKIPIEYIYVDQPNYKLGEGSYGSVFKCYTRQHNKVYRYAVKIIRVPEYSGSIMFGQDIISTTRQEIKTLMKFKDNPNIIKIQDLIRIDKIIYLVLEYCNDKDITSYFKKLRYESASSSEIKLNDGKKPKSQIQSIQQINFYMAQLLNGFRSMNSQNITHRDFKPGNILVNNGVLKIADFGNSKPVFQKSELMNEYVGTLCTAAPQIRFQQNYTTKCDIYSLGVVYYWMIYGKYPWKDFLSKDEYLKTKVEFCETGADGWVVSDQVKKLIKSMIAYDEDQRPEFGDLFSHKFFLKYISTLNQPHARISFDRGMTFMQSEDFNQKIPEEFYKYVSEKDIQMNRISVDQYQDFICVMRSISWFNLKITFFKQLLRQLASYVAKQDSQTQIQEETLCQLIRLGIQKYTIMLSRQLQSQITFKDIPKILDRNALKSLQNTEQFNQYSKDLLNQINSFQESQQKPKLSRDKISQLRKKCEEYKIADEFETILKQQKESIMQQLLIQQIGKAIIELFFLIKPEIKNFHFKKQQLKTSIEQNKFKYLVLLVHHLNMFIMRKEIFFLETSKDMSNVSQELILVNDFLKREKFQDRESFLILANEVQFLLDRFEE